MGSDLTMKILLNLPDTPDFKVCSEEEISIWLESIKSFMPQSEIEEIKSLIEKIRKEKTKDQE